MDTQHKLEVLKEACADEAELDQVVGKLLDLTLGQHRRRLERYERDLGAFEVQYGMDSATFYRRFEAGELGDAMDFFEWAGLYELRQDLLEKIRRVETAL
jgi:hypothetical protein